MVQVGHEFLVASMSWQVNSLYFFRDELLVLSMSSRGVQQNSARWHFPGSGSELDSDGPKVLLQGSDSDGVTIVDVFLYENTIRQKSIWKFLKLNKPFQLGSVVVFENVFLCMRALMNSAGLDPGDNVFRLRARGLKIEIWIPAAQLETL